MTDVLLAVGWVASALLVVAGTSKVGAPAATSRALRLAGLPSESWLVRALGAGEVVLGVMALLGVPFAMAGTGLAYAAFTVFAVRQRRDPAADCGCFGTDATPLTRLHVTVDAVLAAACLVAAALAPTSTARTLGVLDLLGDAAALEVVLATVLLGATTWLVRVLLVDLPHLADRLVRTSPERTAPTGSLVR